jgi:predicted ArsR family transcriptional regulator
MKTSRQRILEFFELKGIVSARDIASALRMTSANARHHLRVLADNGVVVNAGQRTSSERGRPEQVYQLAHQAGANNLALLSAALLVLINRTLKEEKREEFIQTLAAEILAEVEPSKILNLGLRLQSAVRKLNEMNYQARWEARSSHPRLILGHCPYSAILLQFPEICMLDKYLANHLTGTRMEQIAKLAVVSPGIRQCIFEVQA